MKVSFAFALIIAGVLLLLMTYCGEQKDDSFESSVNLIAQHQVKTTELGLR